MNTYTVIDGELVESDVPAVVLSRQYDQTTLALHSSCGCESCAELRKAAWYAADCPPPEVIRARGVSA